MKIRRVLFYLLYCVVFAIGIVSYGYFYAMCAFHARHKYPYLYPFVKVAMPASAIVCLVMFGYALYKCIDKEGGASAKNIGKMLGRGALISVVGGVPMACVISYLMEFVGRLF